MNSFAFPLGCQTQPSMPAGFGAPLRLCLLGLCTSRGRKEKSKTQEEEGDKSPFEVQHSAFRHPLMLLCQDRQPMAQ